MPVGASAGTAALHLTRWREAAKKRQRKLPNKKTVSILRAFAWKITFPHPAMNDTSQDKKSQMNIEELSAIVVDCAYKLHIEAGPGLLESVYEVVLAKMLEDRGLRVRRQVPVPINLMSPLRRAMAMAARSLTAGDQLLSFFKSSSWLDLSYSVRLRLLHP